ncbi:DMT family transporter [Companilactobacillus sp.]|jgi:transporter family-2 protein|uniref:DMT family transporter n=1 Tax=Companilactobacillus sp. TaxID=2767905 RepID=UPI0025C07E64|nr:DMT family transporter [Companilactobacillus sp.]MCH4009443.1 DMT family transporter [Companilactobacillus sp.]MCH4050378.1 DMT family transporter [Companilactobacillus sp.]MCH4077385.1 DMT family transporter [Companilactobacillus sp.]MCH4125961.1 DMT family transporter [Companilactobacillus sp.]MCI1311670.1 DMT family transporter [Companilactobacillus sp.]
MLAILIGIVIGIGLPMQTSINSRLKVAVGSPFVASLTSFTLGTIFLAIITLIMDHSLLFSSKLFATQPIWLWIGGFLGVIYLTSNILLFPKLGSVQTVIFPILGQIIMGLAIDNFGLFDSIQKPLSLTRFFGALLVISGVVCAVAMDNIIRKFHKTNLDEPKSSGLIIWRTLGIVAGMLGASQTAINGHLGVVLKSSVKAAFISFLVGTIALIVIVLILHPSIKLTTQNGKSNPWWMWIGGVIGALFVFGNAYLVPIIGTGLAVVIILVGQMTGSLLVDQFGLLESNKNPVTPIQIVGILIMIAGVALIRLF